MPLVGRMPVAGVGLIGGSLALAARDAGLVGEVIGCGRSTANLDLARRGGIIDRVASSDADAADADLIVLAVPVGSSRALAERLRTAARPTTILTDVGSVKATVVQALEAAWPDPARVVGAHPIAGSEASGAGAARGDLFRDRLCILTPTARTAPPALEVVRSLWRGVGARIEEMPAVVHDAILARVSHLPHVVAYALVRTLAGRTRDGRALLDYAGSGLRDTTRVAASAAELWRDIVLANRTAVRDALGEFRDALGELERLIDAGDAAGLDAALAAAANVRRGLGSRA